MHWSVGTGSSNVIHIRRTNFEEYTRDLEELWKVSPVSAFERRGNDLERLEKFNLEVMPGSGLGTYNGTYKTVLYVPYLLDSGR